MIKVAVIQRSAAGTKEHNIEESIFLARSAVEKYPGLDLIVYPEDNNCFEPTPAEAYATAETIDGPYVSAMRQTAKELGVNINIGSFTEKTDGGKTCNTLLVITRQGEIAGKYSKVHLSDAMGFKESDYVKAGDSLALIETDIGKLGIIICYDMRFPEHARSLALNGADIICVSALWPCGNPLPSRIDHWDVLTRATALYNLTYVLAANQFGKVSGEVPFGRSCIVDPWGCTIAQAGEGTQIIYGELDMGYQRKVRQSVATFENRRPELYNL